MAPEEGFLIPEYANFEVRSWAVHFPRKCRGDRIISLPGHSKERAETLLDFLRQKTYEFASVSLQRGA